MSSVKDPVKTKNMQFLRNTNRSSIIKRLSILGPASRVDLSAELGLSRMAISAIVSDLIKEQYIIEQGHLHSDDFSSTSGRKPTALVLKENRINAIGILIKRYEIHCLAIEIHGKVISHSSHVLPADADNDYLMDSLYELIQSTLTTYSIYPFAGIGIASIGPIDIYSNRLLWLPNFCRIGGLDIGRLLELRFSLPTFIDNDMNASVIAEQFYGIGKSMNNLVYIGLGTGVGAGVITNGKILKGNGGFAGEIGHISINPGGALCSCGQHGCLELYTNISSLLRNTGVDSLEDLACILSRQNVPGYIWDSFEIYKKSVRTLLISAANLFDPEIIIIGDQALQILVPYFKELEKDMNKTMFHHGFKTIQVVPCTFADMTPMLGAGSIIFQKIFSGELPLPSTSDTRE